MSYGDKDERDKEIKGGGDLSELDIRVFYWLSPYSGKKKEVGHESSK